MSTKHSTEDGGYGAGNLVGSSESGLRSAIEGREALEAARERAAPRPTGRERPDRGHASPRPSGLHVDPRADAPVPDATHTTQTPRPRRP